jgi:hypothetical protein
MDRNYDNKINGINQTGLELATDANFSGTLTQWIGITMIKSM